MNYKKDPQTGMYEVWHSQRHPITRQPITLRRKNIKTEAEAKRVMMELVIQVNERIHAKISPSWEKVVSQFLTNRREVGITEHSIHDYECGLRKYTMPIWGLRFIDTITTKEIREVVQNAGESCSVAYQKNILKFIRAVFKYAHEMGYVPSNPTPDLRLKEGSKIRRVLTQEQAKRLLEEAQRLDWYWYPHWVMALYTGLRNGELYALTWDKVDFESENILVNCSWNNKDGFKSTKSGDDRYVPINKEVLLPFLKRLKLSSESSYVLPRDRKWSKGEQARELRLFLTSVGIPHVRFHDLRATWATMLLSKGVAPAKVMKVGGWKDMKTMMVYLRMSGIDVQGTTDKLSIFDPTQEFGEIIDLKTGSRSNS